GRCSMKRSSFTPNPVLVSFMGLCPLVATTGNFATGLSISIGTSIGILSMALFGRLSKGLVPPRLMIPSYLGFASLYALFLGIILEAWSPVVALDLGIFVPLIAVNCLLIHEMHKADSRETVEFSSTLVIALTYFLLAALISALRESLGSGTLTLPTPGYHPLRIIFSSEGFLPVLTKPTGGFLVLGLVAFGWHAGSGFLEKIGEKP
ncbi:MAG: Rnf-Nqr domain containing protein, partial [Spirochaetota bacterium]